MNKHVLIFFVISLILFAYSWFASKWAKGGEKRGDITSGQVAGFFLWQAIDRWINYLVYPAVLVWMGLSYGTVFMVGITLIINIVYIRVNSKTEIDWTFMSWLIHMRDCSSTIWPMKYCRLLKWKREKNFAKILRKVCVSILYPFRRVLQKKPWGNIVGFLVFTVKDDSFFAINFLFHKKADLRKGSVLSLFLLSHIICNLVWLPVAMILVFVYKIFYEIMGGVSGWINEMYQSLVQIIELAKFFLELNCV